jgi:hypothetical protein
MKKDEVNVIVEDVFTQEEIDTIYQCVANGSGNSFVEPHAQANTFINLPQNIINKVTQKARELSCNENLVVTEYCHARYANVTSHCGKFHFKPSLFPHFDETFKEPRFTFDYQINANIDWPLIVAPDKKFVLKNNQALTFSGTHQIHWREPKHFTDDQYVEMVFFHFSDPTVGLKSEELNEQMIAQAIRYKSDFFANGGFSNNENR